MSTTRPTDITHPDMYTGETPLVSAQSVWKDIQSVLAHAVGQNVHRSWTARLTVSEADAYSVTLVAPTRFIATKIETAYAEPLRRLWRKHDLVAPPRRVIISSGTMGTVKPADTFASTPAAMSRGPQDAVRPAGATDLQGNVTRPKLVKNMNERTETTPRNRFSFDNFVVGPSNEFAYAVARKIATEDTVQYNPVVIHGVNGMGKTHLLYAVKNHVEKHTPHRQTRLISGEAFVNTFVGSVRANGRDAINTFKASMRRTDLLMIDDAHFITNKPGSQEEFLHTLVSLVDEGRQIVVVTDKHPDEIDSASPRLRSYLTSGLVCKIGAADYELRLQMLDRLIARRRNNGNPGLTIPQAVRDHLAARINATPRDLEGAFNQVIAQSEYLGTPVTLESVQTALSDSRYTRMERLTVDKIQKAVSEAFEISLNEMVSKRRARIVARPRQVAMYLCKSLTQKSLPDIGRRFGGRDHTTVIHAVKRITELRASDPALDEKIIAIETTLKG